MTTPLPFAPLNRRLVVLKGGPGSERDVSLRSGAAVASALRSAGAHVEEVEVVGTDVIIPEGTDLVFNLIHGTFGEDGTLQSLLEQQGLAYTGEGIEESRIAFDKILTKKALAAADVQTPGFEILRAGGVPSLPLPIVIKAPRQRRCSSRSFSKRDPTRSRRLLVARGGNLN